MSNNDLIFIKVMKIDRFLTIQRTHMYCS